MDKIKKTQKAINERKWCCGTCGKGMDMKEYILDILNKKLEDEIETHELISLYSGDYDIEENIIKIRQAIEWIESI